MLNKRIEPNAIILESFVSQKNLKGLYLKKEVSNGLISFVSDLRGS